MSSCVQSSFKEFIQKPVRKVEIHFECLENQIFNLGANRFAKWKSPKEICKNKGVLKLLLDIANVSGYEREK